MPAPIAMPAPAPMVFGEFATSAPYRVVAANETVSEPAVSTLIEEQNVGDPPSGVGLDEVQVVDEVRRHDTSSGYPR